MNKKCKQVDSRVKKKAVLCIDMPIIEAFSCKAIQPVLPQALPDPITPVNQSIILN